MPIIIIKANNNMQRKKSSKRIFSSQRLFAPLVKVIRLDSSPKGQQGITHCFKEKKADLTVRNSATNTQTSRIIIIVPTCRSMESLAPASLNCAEEPCSADGFCSSIRPLPGPDAASGGSGCWEP